MNSLLSRCNKKSNCTRAKLLLIEKPQGETKSGVFFYYLSE